MQVRTKVVIGGLVGAVLGAGLAGGLVWAEGPSASAAGCGGSTPRLTVQGTGMASGTPDQLTLTADVSVVAGSAQSALSQDDTQAATVVAALTGAGVVASDVQTTGLTVQPDYTTTDGTTVLAGYAVDNSVVATITHVAAAGRIIDAVTAAGGDAVRIDSLAFSIADPRRLEDRARQDAVHQAVAHAASMAAAAGQHLAGLCSVTDESATQQNPNSSGFALSAAAPAVPLEAGTQQATAQVSLVYALRPATGP